MSSMKRHAEVPDPRLRGPDGKPDIAALITRSDEVQRAMGRAVRRALLVHKKLGNPITVWRDEEVVWISPEEIEIDEADDDQDLGPRP
jgi:hypothetical protein